jgi:tetratricopeptide (TPR) repeat protein
MEHEREREAGAAEAEPGAPLVSAMRTALAEMDGRVAQMVRLVSGTWPAVGRDDDGTGGARARALVTLLRGEADSADDAVAVPALEEVARLCEDDLGDRRSAAKSVLEALRREPRAAGARRTAVRLLMDGEGSELFAQLVEDLADALETVGDREALLLDYALHEELRRGNKVRAAEICERVLADGSGNIEAAEGVLRFGLRDNAWGKLSRLCRDLADREEDAEMRAMLLILAALMADDRPVSERALWAAQAAAVYRDGDMALPMAVGMFRAAADWESAIRVQLEQTGEATPQAARLHFQASWMFASSQGRTAEALEHAEKARAYQPDNVLYLSWLCEIYESESRWPDLAGALEHKATIDTTREDCLETLFQLGEVLSTHLGQTDRAIAALERAVEISPTDLACLQALGRLYARVGRWEKLLQMHLQEASVTEEPYRRANAMYGAARLMAQHLERRDEAIEQLEHAVELYPAHVPALRLLEDLYKAAERYVDLVQLYRRELQDEQREARRIALLERVGELLDVRLGDVQGATAAYEELLDLQPDSLVSLRALARLYEQRSEHGKLLSILRAQAMCAATEEERATLLLRMGQILEEEVARPEQALAHYREALSVYPSPQAFERVGRLLHALKRWKELLELSQKELEVTTTAAARLRLLFRQGQLYERYLGDPQAAAGAYRQVLELDGGHWPALRALTRVAHHLPDLRRMGLESMLLEQLSDRSVRANAQIRIALSLLNQQRDAAKEILRRAVAEDESSGMARDLLLQLVVEDGQWADVVDLVAPMEAVVVSIGGVFNLADALRRSREESERRPESLCALRWYELLQSASDDSAQTASVLARRAEKESEAARRAALFLRLAAWLQNVESGNGDAAAVFRQLLAEQPGNTRALDGLERLARLREDQGLLREVLELREQRATTPKERARTQVARGDSCARAGQMDEAIQYWRGALENDPTCRAAYDGLKWAYGSAEDDAGLLWALERSAHLAYQPEARTRDLLRRSDLHARAGSVEQSLADLELILRDDPAQLNALERLHSLLEPRGEIGRLLGALGAGADATKLPACRSALLVKQALLYREAQQDLQAALDCATQAIEADPDNVAALLVAADLRQALDQPTEAVSLLNRVVLRSAEPSELIGAHLTLAHLFVDVVGDAERARRSLLEVLELDPENQPALRHLAEMETRGGDDAKAEQWWRKLVAAQHEPQERARSLVRLCQVVARRHGSTSEELVDWVDEALDALPTDATVLRLAMDVYSATSRWEDLAEVLGIALQQVSDDQRTALLLRRAEVLSQHLGKRDEARELLRELVRIDPEQDRATELLLEHLDDASLEDPSLRDEAITLHRQLLARDPLLSSSLRKLGELFERADSRADEAFCVQSALVFLGEASEEQLYFHKQRRRKLPATASGQLSSEQTVELVLPHGDHPVRRVLAALKPHLSELVVPDLTQYGFESLEEAALPSDHPVQDVVAECARILAAGDVRLVEALGGAADGTTEPGAIPSLVLPRDFSRLPVPQQRFLCGRMLARVVSDTECLDHGRAEALSRRDLQILLAAVVRTGDPTYGDQIASVAILDDLARQIAQTTDQRVLVEVRDDALQCLTGGQALETLDGWLRAAELGTLRAGLLCGGGLEAVSAWVERTGRPLSEQLTRGLVQFVCSERYAGLRRQLGLALS